MSVIDGVETRWPNKRMLLYEMKSHITGTLILSGVVIFVWLVNLWGPTWFMPAFITLLCIIIATPLVAPVPRAIREYRFFRAKELEQERLRICQEIHDS